MIITPEADERREEAMAAVVADGDSIAFIATFSNLIQKWLSTVALSLLANQS